MNVFGDSPTALRGLSVTMGMVAVAGCGLIGRDLFATLPLQRESKISLTERHNDAIWFGLYCAALCAVSAFQVHASVEARMYSLGTALTVWSTLCCLRIWRNPASLPAWSGLVVATTASLYTHHFLAVQAGVQAIWLYVVLRRPANNRESDVTVVKKGWQYWKVSVSIVLVIWLPALWLWLEQFSQIRSGFWIQPLTVWSLPETLLEFFASPPPGRRWEFHIAAGVTTAICLPVIIFVIVNMRRGGAVWKLLLLQAFIPLIVTGVVSLQTPIWEPRYFRFAHISFILLIAGTSWCLSPKPMVRLSANGFALSAFLCGSVFFWHSRDIADRQAVRGAMEFILKQQVSSPRQVVVRSPLDYVVAEYYARQHGLAEDQVKLWTGHDQDPGAAGHLLKATDWCNTETFTSEEIWLLESEECPDRLIVPSTHSTAGYFPSDLWLSGWTVHVARCPGKTLHGDRNTPDDG